MPSQTKIYDDLWSSLAKRVFNSPAGIKCLSADEQTYFAVRYFQSQHYNGGFEQVFHNGTGDYYREIVAALPVVGAKETCGLLQLAARLAFKGKKPPTDSNDRFSILSSHPTSRWQDDLDLLDGAVYNCGENLTERSYRFASEKALVPAIETKVD